MKMYRVYIRRPSTQPPIWDWAQTVSASNEEAALKSAYEDWRKWSSDVPPLSKCQHLVKPVEVLAAAPVASGQQTFIDMVQKQVSDLLSTQLDGPFSSVSYPSGFNYGITYGVNDYYNSATLQDIDTLLSMSKDGRPVLTGNRFSTLYTQILQAVTFSFSQADQKTMNDQDTAAAAQVHAILREFEDAGGTYSSPLPFGGKLQDVFNQMNKQYKSLDNIPDTLNKLRNAIATYKAQAGASYALKNRYYRATDRIAAAIANATTPTADNGGQQVDAKTYYVGYTPNKLPTANQLIGALNTTKNAVHVQIDLSNFSSTSCQVGFSGGSMFQIPIADFLGISVNGSASFDLSRYTSSSSSITMDLNYPGVTMFPSAPSPLATDNATGWYASDILQEVVANAGQGATGYQLQGHEFLVDELFGQGKRFSRLKTFVISQQPTITMTFTAANLDSVVSDFRQNATVAVTLLGLFRIGSASESYHVRNVDSSSEAGKVVVTFGPPEVSGTTPLEQQIAYVLGGVTSYPPVSLLAK